jgi:ferric-dicitrate binding protein FerR (iron transport regulator)
MKNRNDSIKYISADEFRNMNPEEKIMKMAEGLIPPKGRDEQTVLEAIFSKPEQPVEVKTISLRRYFQSAAAVILLLIGIYSVSMVYSNQKVKTDFGSQKELTLPDGSLVLLNSGSKLVWNERTFHNKRIVTLTGEGYFEIKKGSEFLIKTKNGNVEILGTQLNVFSREKEFRVSCISGKVMVDASNSKQIILPGEMAELTASGLSKRVLAEVDQTAAWKDGRFYFEDKPLVSIFDEIERQFDVSIEYNGEQKRKITVSFTNSKLEEALDVVCIPMGLKYEVSRNNQVKISENFK